MHIQCYLIKVFEKKNIFASFLKPASLLISFGMNHLSIEIKPRVLTYITVPSEVGVNVLNVFLKLHHNGGSERSDFIASTHLYTRTKPFPWGNGRNYKCALPHPAYKPILKSRVH
ncbi:hypothetical protein U0070_022250 [Myodes glareolus]|uniref:Uncharacterized protein n=1 Tax=Myodes glareolus TaxID=447135 RepID=A0AAW0HGQ6_MYOGA